MTLEDLLEARVPHPVTLDNLFKQVGKLCNDLLGRRLEQMSPTRLGDDASAPQITSDGHGNGPAC